MGGPDLHRPAQRVRLGVRRGKWVSHLLQHEALEVPALHEFLRAAGGARERMKIHGLCGAPRAGQRRSPAGARSRVQGGGVPPRSLLPWGTWATNMLSRTATMSLVLVAPTPLRDTMWLRKAQGSGTRMSGRGGGGAGRGVVHDRAASKLTTSAADHPLWDRPQQTSAHAIFSVTFRYAACTPAAPSCAEVRFKGAGVVCGWGMAR